MENYNKSEKFYNEQNDIFTKLGMQEGLRYAREEAYPFEISRCHEESCSEMYKFFDFFDDRD